jgi:hypothetical protein
MPRGSLVDGQSEAFNPIPSQRVEGTASDAMARGNRMFYGDRYNILPSPIPKFPTTSASIDRWYRTPTDAGFILTVTQIHDGSYTSTFVLPDYTPDDRDHRLDLSSTTPKLLYQDQ